MKDLFQVFIEEATVGEITGTILFFLAGVAGLCFILETLIPALVIIILFLLWAFSYAVASLLKLHFGDKDD